MNKQSHQEEQTKAESKEKHNIAYMCLEAEQLTHDAGPERALEALEDLARTYPNHSVPRISLAKLYRWMALERNDTDGPFDRSRLRIAVDHAKHAVALEDPPELATLELASDMLHLMAEHAERASFVSSLADKHPDPAISLKAFTWASEAFQCLGMELEAEGKDEEANSAYQDSVKMHRQALQAWPDAPVVEKLSSYRGCHTMQAYMAIGLAEKWVNEFDELLVSDEGLAIPEDMRADYFSQASEMAVEAGLYQKGVNLAEKALRIKEGGENACTYRIGTISVLGSLLMAYHATGDESAEESVAERIEGMLRYWEEDVEEDRNLSPGNHLSTAYNFAARAFVMVEDWERAIFASRRATELCDYGPNYWFLAVSLWVGRRDREGALSALRNAAQDKLHSGKAECRNLRDDFKRDRYFSDVHEDEDFLAAVEVGE